MITFPRCVTGCGKMIARGVLAGFSLGTGNLVYDSVLYTSMFKDHPRMSQHLSLQAECASINRDILSIDKSRID